MKKIITLFITTMMLFSLVGCSLNKVERDPVLSENLPTILEKIYENADFSDEQRESLKYYQTSEIDQTNVEGILGTKEIEFTDAISSAPMMSSIPYQLVLIKLDENADVDATKEIIKENADPRKWICVEAEEVIVESIDNIILFIMADESEATAVRDAFLDLSEVK